LAHQEIIVDTTSVPSHTIQRYIQESLNEVVQAEFDVKDMQRFHARWQISQCGNCTMMRMLADGDSASSIRRTAAHLSLESDVYCQIIRVQRGVAELRQRGKTITLKENQFAVLATDAPFETRRPRGLLDVYSVRLPLRLLSSRLQNPEDYTLRPLSIRTGIESIAIDYMETLAEKMQGTPAAMWPALINQLADLMSLTMMGMKEDQPSSESALRFATLDRLKAFIGERLMQPDLNPTAIAAANGLSRRYLHRLFQESGQSVGDFIRTQRLASARRALESPLHAGDSIADIAFTHGFRSAAHFSKVYSDEFREPPRQTRSRLWQKLQADRERRRSRPM
jgi:AraC-like DNA-binding protein